MPGHGSVKSAEGGGGRTHPAMDSTAGAAAKAVKRRNYSGTNTAGHRAVSLTLCCVEPRTDPADPYLRCKTEGTGSDP